MRQKITNGYTKMWELGTDCLTENDLKLLHNDDYVSFMSASASIINVELLKFVYTDYSPIMKEILDQAIENGYDYVMFDCDLETNVDKVVT